MALTDAQLATLKAAIIADPTAGPIRLSGDTVALGNWCNGAKSPVVLAWRTNISIQESDEAATYTAYDTLQAGKRDSWALFLKFNRNFSKNKVRNWIVDVWGAVVTSSISEDILKIGIENATNAQVVFGGTVRNAGTAATTALDRNYSDQVSQIELNKLVN